MWTRLGRFRCLLGFRGASDRRAGPSRGSEKHLSCSWPITVEARQAPWCRCRIGCGVYYLSR